MRKEYLKYSDEQLVDIMKTGTRRNAELAFTEIYDRYGLRINAYCQSILNDPDKADDIFQETFLKFFQNVKNNYQQGSLVGFLITIARNLCLNAKRDAKPTIPIEEFDFLVTNEQESYEDKELADLVMMAIDLIDNEYREAIVLRLMNDLRYKEIAEILDITDARARYLVFNGKQKIREILAPYIEIEKKKNNQIIR